MRTRKQGSQSKFQASSFQEYTLVLLCGDKKNLNSRQNKVTPSDAVFWPFAGALSVKFLKVRSVLVAAKQTSRLSLQMLSGCLPVLALSLEKPAQLHVRMRLILQLGHAIWLTLLDSIMAVQTITPLLAMVSDQTLSRTSVGN